MIPYFFDIQIMWNYIKNASKGDNKQLRIEKIPDNLDSPEDEEGDQKESINFQKQWEPWNLDHPWKFHFISSWHLEIPHCTFLSWGM